MNPCHILVVEDEAIVAMDLEDRLTAMGYRLAGVTVSGERALELVRHQRPDLVLMDIRLQGDMDGIETAEEMRRQFHVPVIFLTAYSEDATLERLKLAEPFGYILKPFNDRELKSTIEIALYKHRAEEEMRRLNRLYDVLSQVNQSVVRCRSREELLPTVCRLVVERGGMDLAWIGWLDPETSRIDPVAHFGDRFDILSHAQFYADDRPEGQGNPGKAVREGKPFVCNECGGGVCAYPSSMSPAHFGLLSCASFPLRFQGEVWGALNVCAAESGSFREREVQLLEEVAFDISFALDKIEGDIRRESAQEELAAERVRLRTLISTIPDLVWLKDAQGVYLVGNPAFECFMGVKEADLLGKTDYDFFPRALAEFFRTHDHNAVLAGKPTVNEEWVTYASDGRHVLLETIKTPMLDEQGQLVGVLGIARDITVARKAQEELHESEERFRLAMEATSDGLWDWDVSGGAVYYSPNYFRMLGYEPLEGPGKIDDWLDLVHPEDRERILAANEACIRNDAPAFSVEFRMRSHDGTWRWILGRGKATRRDPAGHALRMIGTHVDITERKRAEREIKRNEENALQLARENAIMVEIGRIISSTLDIDEIYEGFSEEVKKLIPFDRIVINMIDVEEGEVRNVYMAGDELHDRNVRDIYPLEGSGNAEMVRTKSALLIQTEEFDAYRDRFPMLASTFEAGFRSIMNIPLFSKGKTIGGLLLRSRKPFAYTDKEVKLAERIGSQIAGAIANAQLYAQRIEAEHRRAVAEAQLRQAQKMESLGTLAGGIAHDFNNILGIIVGYAQMAQWNAGEGNKASGDLQQVLRAAGRAKDLVQQILAFSRQHGQEKNPVQVGLIVKEALKMLRSSLPSTIDIQSNVASKSTILADPTQIHQVLMNLCANAAHAMGDGGTLEVNLMDIHLRAEDVPPHSGLQPGPHVCLTVKDTGVGIDPAIIDRIFDPFFTTKGVGVGTGLGLAVVHGIVKSHGGSIDVGSLPGKGTTFEVFFPTIGRTRNVEQTGGPLPRGRGRILVVDDEPALAMVMRAILERLGYAVDCRTSSVEALDAFRNQPADMPFDLVITDMTMPQLTGAELARQLHQLQPDLPIILCTGFSDRIDAEKAKELGMRGFCLKPVVLKDLAELVRKALQR
ncbi:MAG: response regulator [Syntrophobacteraceae bacterium]